MVLTAARPKGREAAIQLTYGKADITARIENDVESFRYTDVAASQSDTMSITINAREDKWKMPGCRKRVQNSIRLSL